MTCLILISSPSMVDGMFSSTSSTSLTFLPFRRTLIMVETSIIIEDIWNGSVTRSILPASILEKSRISLIIVSREAEAFLIMMAFSLAKESVVSRIINSDMPLMAFIGVRISWDILARKLVFALSALSARSLAVMISVISTMIIMTPAISFWSLMAGRM